jgi:hypothetical protein
MRLGEAITSPILVTGGTGTLGRQVVPHLRDSGRDVRELSRHGHESKDGVEYVTADLLKGDDEAIRNLMRAAPRAGARHVVYISVIGADRVPLGYFRSKLAAEQAVTDSGIPWTTLRAAQFHDLAAYGLGAVRQLTWIFGWFRECITAYRPPHEFHYLVERSVPPLRHEGGRLTFTEVPGGTRVHWTTTVELRLPIAAAAAPRLLGRPMIVYTFGRVLDAADAALTCGSDGRGSEPSGERGGERRWRRAQRRDDEGPTGPVRRSRR